MSRLMQMAELMIRGGIATQTMKNLTPDQMDEINKIVDEVVDYPEIAADRVEMCKQLANTIGGDYRSDKDAAVQEFRIAIWRATVYLLHHRKYGYNCKLCGATEYKTSNGTAKVFDRQYKICPSCNGTYFIKNKKQITCYVKDGESKKHILVDSDDTRIFPADGDGMTKNDLKDCTETPINVVCGQQKYEDPRTILADPIQRRKWYKTWIWNYFKQILNENLIRTHNKHQTEISGPADEIVVRSIINELKREKRKFYFDESSYDRKSKKFEIFVNTYQTPVEFTRFLAMIQISYSSIGIQIDVDRYAIYVNRFNAPIVNAVVIEEDPVIMVSSNTSPTGDDDNEGDSWKDAIEYSTHYNYDGDINKVESDDLMNTIRDNLHDNKTRAIFDIYSQHGKTWDDFSSKWGEQPACKSHIAKYLDINIKEVDDHREMIKTQCLAFNLN